MVDLSKHKLELAYPCNWKYKIVLLEKSNANNISKEILGERSHKIKKSNVSKNGKFISYDVELIVFNDDDRVELHTLFNNHVEIKMVL